MRHLVLAGGPGHDFAGIGAALARLTAEVHGDEAVTVVLTDPAAVLDRLRAVEAGDEEPWGLLTVAALRWRMEAERYADQRDEAYTLTDDDAAVIERHVAGGGGLLALHTAVICFDAQPRWRRLCGAAWDWEASSHPPAGPVPVVLTAAGRDHPLTVGLDDFTVQDEAYGFLDEDPDLVALLTSGHGGRDHPLLWAREVGAGRVVTDLLGHGPGSLAHPAHRTILERVLRWAPRRAGATVP